MNPYNKERASVKDALSLWRKSGVISLLEKNNGLQNIL